MKQDRPEIEPMPPKGRILKEGENPVRGCFLKSNKKTFPSYEEFFKWYRNTPITTHHIYNYFEQFQYEKTVYPKVGDMVEGVGLNTNNSYKGIIPYFILKTATEGTFSCESIRPVSRPTREQVISKLTDEELEVLGLTR